MTIGWNFFECQEVTGGYCQLSSGVDKDWESGTHVGTYLEPTEDHSSRHDTLLRSDDLPLQNVGVMLLALLVNDDAAHKNRDHHDRKHQKGTVNHGYSFRSNHSVTKWYTIGTAPG